MYSNKQKRRIYLKAAKIIENKKTPFGCIALDMAINRETLVSEQTLLFEEFSLFKPETRDTIGWWPVKYDIRITALLLCSEMCN
jgi:hypothetical protein